MAPSVFQYLSSMVFPLPFMGASLFCEFSALLLPDYRVVTKYSDFGVTLLQNPLLPFSDLDSFKEKAFANLWFTFGPVCADDIPESLPPLLANCQGLILDVGPGSGDQVKRFSRPDNITAIYGVEPSVSMHDKLKERAKEAGLGDKYHVLSATADLDAIIPELIKAGMIKESHTSSTDLQIFDTIICLRVLCGVPDQPSSVADLYSLLKPGGKFVVCEHVLNTGHTPARLAQQLYMLMGWKHLMGGCCLTRNTMETLLRVANVKDGGWAKVEVQHTDELSPVIHAVGVLTKK